MIKQTVISTLLALATVPLIAASPAVTLNYNYTDTDTGEKKTGSAATKMSLQDIINKGGSFYSHPNMVKTEAVVEFSKVIGVALQNWQETCNSIVRSDVRETNQELRYTQACLEEKSQVIEAFASGIYNIQNKIAKVQQSNKERILSFNSLASIDFVEEKSYEFKLNDQLVRAKKLLQLMKRAKPQIRRVYAMRSAAPAPSARLSIATGGAQDAKKYRDKIEANQIPSFKDFAADGFIKEFKLDLMNPCKTKFCMEPAVAYDAETKTLLVQSSFETAITEENFARKDSNIGILIDVSGSMGAIDKKEWLNDEVEKDRLYWANEAVKRTLERVRVGKDYLTISSFGTNAHQVWPKPGAVIGPVSEEDKAKILKAVSELKPSGSTNLRAGLDKSYALINGAKKEMGYEKAKKYNHRLIMISDANYNHDKSGAGAFNKVTEMATERRDIGLTVIGVGLDFFQDFVEKLGNTRGGNYIFAQNGQDMLEYFKRFNLLISPIAYDFSAELGFDSSKLEFKQIHGVGGEAAAKPMDNIMSIKTMFFTKSSESGGGAVVQEYKVK